MNIYTENLYIVVWAILFFGWLGAVYLAYKKSSLKNKVRNTALVFLLGVVLTFLAISTNPLRKNNLTTVNPMNFTIPENRDIPERITVEPKLTDEKRAESLEAERRSSKEREIEEFGESFPDDTEAEKTKGE